MKRNKRGRFVSVPMAKKMEKLSEGQRQRQRWVRDKPLRPEGEAAAAATRADGRRPETAAPTVVTTSYCRLCHGKFSSRSLRNVFAKVPLIDTNPERQRRAQQIFCADFQRLVGIVVRQDPTLPQFICRNCHTQFYKCRSILRNFIQRVNSSPMAPVQRGQEAGRYIAGTEMPFMPSLSEPLLGDSIPDIKQLLNDRPLSASPQCLQILVTWAHHHGSSCKSSPSLQSVLSAEYRGVVRAAWGCQEGHSYILDTHLNHNVSLSEEYCPRKENNNPVKEEMMESSSSRLLSQNGSGTENGEGGSISKSQPVPVSLWSSDSQPCAHSGVDLQPTGADSSGRLSLSKDMLSRSQPVAAECSWETPHLQNATRVIKAKGQMSCNEASCSIMVDAPDGLESSDLSDRYLSSEEDQGEQFKSGSSDESFQPYCKNKILNKKCDSKEVKKPTGQKRGRKPKLNSEREDLPTMYRCQYKGCCAVYRGADGLKKHIKEHHEEVRERPCPHPGCNKVFLIDRYLQRHVKLIHTEERNYICDECGQTFKQRKHLSVHQMRHSGAKPLQCEICGFQCRQRASLKYHMTKHKAEAELDFACDQCGKRFEKAHNLNVHMSMVHPLTQNTDKNKPTETIETEKKELTNKRFTDQDPT